MSREYICQDCGHIGTAKKLVTFRTNFLLSSLLWFLMLPGLLYLVWYLIMGRKRKCSQCGSSAVSTMNSAYGKASLEELCLKNLADDIAAKKETAKENTIRNDSFSNY